MLDGYKTHLGGAGFILVGVGTTLSQYYEGAPITWNENIALIAAGISIIGGRSAYKKAHPD